MFVIRIDDSLWGFAVVVVSHEVAMHTFILCIVYNSSNGAYIKCSYQIIKNILT